MTIERNMTMSNHDLDWLVSQQPDEPPLDPGARERALRALVQHTSSAQRDRGPNLGDLFRTRRFGIPALMGIAALAAAAVVIISGGGRAQTTPGTSATQSHALHASAHRTAVRTPLVRLADDVSTSPVPAGNATVVERTTTSADGQATTVYDLYADDGRYFFSPTQGGLAGEVGAHHNLAGGQFAREIAAAKLAFTGDVQTAAQDMADAPDPSHVVNRNEKVNQAAIKAKEAATGQPVGGGTLFDNYAWEDSQDALVAGSGQPDVRAGVLRILATLPGVTVTHGTSGGQPTLELTAGTPELGAGVTEQLTINADTGVPIQFVGGSSTGGPTGTVDYHVSRATFAALPSGTANSA